MYLVLRDLDRTARTAATDVEMPRPLKSTPRAPTRFGPKGPNSGDAASVRLTWARASSNPLNLWQSNDDLNGGQISIP